MAPQPPRETARSRFPPGTVVAARYRIVRLLGEGGMGAVFEAHQLAVDRRVALKVLRPDAAETTQAAARFQAEMRATARIEHPNTIRLYDVGETERGELFLAMEYLDGQTLRQALAGRQAMAGRPALSPERAVRLAVQIAHAVGAGHQLGIVHRDLKPDNVMLLDHFGQPDFVKVLDFGIARSLDDRERPHLTRQGAIVGTPAYMSPEQASGKPIDARTDLYAIGVMLYEMLSGAVPFGGDSTVSVLVAQASQAPPPITERAPSVGRQLGQVVMRLLAKDPADRFQDAGQLAAALQAVVATAGPAAGRSVPATLVLPAGRAATAVLPVGPAATAILPAEGTAGPRAGGTALLPAAATAGPSPLASPSRTAETTTTAAAAELIVGRDEADPETADPSGDEPDRTEPPATRRRWPRVPLGIRLPVLVPVGIVLFAMRPFLSQSAQTGLLSRVPFLPALLADTWTAQAPLHCDRNQQLRIRGVTATLPGRTAVRAMDNCTVTFEDCTIEAATAIEASDNARVFVVGGHVTGTTAALIAEGNARIDVENAQVTGPVRRDGQNARITGVESVRGKSPQPARR